MPQPTEQELLSKFAASLLSIMPYIVGFISALLVEPIRKKLFRPRLELEFKNNRDFKTLTPEHTIMGESKAIFVRVRVKNKSWYTAFGCRAYLVNIERKNNVGFFERTEFVDSLRLAWSCQPRDDSYRSVDMPKNVNQFIDVFSTRPEFRSRMGGASFEQTLVPENFTSTFSLNTQLMPIRYKKLTEEEGQYRYTIVVTADGVEPKVIRIIFKWNKDWETFEVKKG